MRRLVGKEFKVPGYKFKLMTLPGLNFSEIISGKISPLLPGRGGNDAYFYTEINPPLDLGIFPALSC
jgi:hypothetical protein